VHVTKNIDRIYFRRPVCSGGLLWKKTNYYTAFKKYYMKIWHNKFLTKKQLFLLRHMTFFMEWKYAIRWIQNTNLIQNTKCIKWFFIFYIKRQMTVCLFVSPNFITLSPIPLRLKFLERARWKKKNDTKIMGVPPLEKWKIQFFIFAYQLRYLIKKYNSLLSWRSY
jgi:hypothetical protein